jgi:hypothetical protein
MNCPPKNKGIPGRGMLPRSSKSGNQKDLVSVLVSHLERMVPADYRSALRACRRMHVTGCMVWQPQKNWLYVKFDLVDGMGFECMSNTEDQ